MKTSPLMLAGLLGLAAADPIKRQQAAPTPAPRKTIPGHLAFHFEGQSRGGYIGIQPRPDNSKGPVVHAAFSSFIPGTKTTDANCRGGADGGPGVSCAVQITGNPDNTYDLKVQNTGGTTWSGTMIDTVTGAETHIGSWTLPAGTKGLKGSWQGFVEWWPFNDRKKPPTCNLLKRTTVLFGPPRTSTAGAGAGSLGNPFEVFECKGKINYKAKRVGGNVEISVGF
ncbi:hypothetical protein J3458_019368 [Metarhizium acridum]|uniref:uncharacterized protein n=1 Tax=Metarhizium acridum TaxID=92637 RepID=UPI001C6B4F52|nr:hypothetical protein J3458_019368 [Metarhizium acridum]